MESKAEQVRNERQSLKNTQHSWGRFLKNEVHNLTEFNQVMEKFDQEMAKKGAQIVEMETRLKMGKLYLDFTASDLNIVEASKLFLEQIAESQKMTVQQVTNMTTLLVTNMTIFVECI